VSLDERIEGVADHDAEVLQAHLVDALMHWWDELDERDGRAVEDLERLGKDDQRDGAPVPEVLPIGDRMPFEKRSRADVVVPLGNPVREMAEPVRRDVDAACCQPVSLLCCEGPVVTDDVLDRI
jgi:hypothetical protein